MFNKPLVKESILQAWNGPISSQLLMRELSVASRIRSCRKALSQWKKVNKANSKEMIIILQDELEAAQSSKDPSSSKIHRLTRSLLLGYMDEENFWKQKSKDDWILYGDGNTKFFMQQLESLEKGMK